MSFWTTSDKSENLQQNNGTFDAGGGDMEPIPADTQVKAPCEEAKWDSYEGDEYINLKWTVLAPAEFKNRKIFQKVRVMDGDSKKADKAKRMLAAIAANAGGGLLKIEGKPTDMDLQKNLTMKPMALTLQVWEIKDDNGNVEKSGNWVQQVAPLKQQSQPETQPETQSKVDDDLGW